MLDRSAFLRRDLETDRNRELAQQYALLEPELHELKKHLAPSDNGAEVKGDA